MRKRTMRRGAMRAAPTRTSTLCTWLCTWTLGALLLVPGTADAQRVIEVLDLGLGYTDTNGMRAPVLDGAAAGRVAFADLDADLGPDYLVVRRLKARIPRYRVGRAIDLGRDLAHLMRTEAAVMGLSVSAPADADWRVGGTIHDLYLETEPIVFGPIMFYAFLDATFEATGPGGEAASRRLRFHNMYARYNAGFGVRDEASEVLAQFLVESAQEAVARLNRGWFGAPPHPRVEGLASRVAASGVDGSEADLRAVGLSGRRETVPALLALLARENDESARVHVLDALANLGDEEAVAPLARRYPGEDEDCRFFTLKALDYIGGAEAGEAIRRLAVREGDKACRSLAARLEGSSGDD